MSRAFVITIALVASTVGCGESERPHPTGWSDGKGEVGSGDTVKLLTFNTALAKVFPYLPQRAEEIARQVVEKAADVVCLQEVWEQDVANQLLDAAGGVLRQTYRHIWRSPEPRENKTGGKCGTEVSKLGKCKEDNCEGISMFECVGDSGPCETDWNVLDDDCKRCIAANADAKPKKCVKGVDLGVTTIYAPDRYYAGGRDGLLLLSKLPVEGEVVITEHPSEVIQRRTLSATLIGPSSKLLVHCTHTAADVAIIPHPAAGWQRDNIAQIEQLVADTRPEWSAPDRCRVLMGDLNTGPKLTTPNGALAGELVESYARLMTLGFRQYWSEPSCTACSKQGAGGNRDNTIDHILFWKDGCPAPQQVAFARVFDEKMRVGDASITLSDHFGVLATVRY